METYLLICIHVVVGGTTCIKYIIFFTPHTQCAVHINFATKVYTCTCMRMYVPGGQGERNQLP